MKLNKKFLGIFLSLGMTLGFSVLASARDIVEVADAKKESVKLGKKLKDGAKEEKELLKELEVLLKAVENEPENESVYKRVIDFRIKENEGKIKQKGKLLKEAKSKDEKESLKKEIESFKEYLKEMKKLKEKEELSDLDKGNLKANLETSIAMAKSDLAGIEKLKDGDKEEKELLKKLEGLLKALKKEPKNESVYKDIINFRIKENEGKIKQNGKLLKEAKSKDEKESLKKEIESFKEYLKEMKKLKEKEELSDLDKGNLKANLETSIAMAKNDLAGIEKLKGGTKEEKYETVKEEVSKKQDKSYMLGFIYRNTGMEKTKDASFKDLDKLMKYNKTSTKHRVNLYIVVKYILERAKLKKEEIESILNSVCSIKSDRAPEKLKGVIDIYGLFKDKDNEFKSLTTKENIEKIDRALKKIKVKEIKITEAMFEKAKEEINKHYDKYIKDVGGSYKEWKEAFEKGDKEIIALIKKDNNGMIKNIQEKIKKEKLTGKELDLAKKNIKSIKEENKKLDGKIRLDAKHKAELKANFKVQENDVKSFETVKGAVNKLSYSDVKDLNKGLILDGSLKEYEQTISI